MLPGEFLPFLGEDPRTGILQQPWGTLGGTLPRVWPRGQLTTSSLCFPGCRGMKSEACRHDILDRTDVNTGDCKPLHPPHWHHACSPPSTLVGPSCLALFNAELARPADLLHFICLSGHPTCVFPGTPVCYPGLAFSSPGLNAPCFSAVCSWCQAVHPFQGPGCSRCSINVDRVTD